jgi:uncharacterized protein (DUF2235 family)
LAVRAWVEVQESAGHEMQDLIRQCLRCLNSELGFLEDKAKAGSLTEWEEKAFELFKSRQKKLQSKKPRDKLGVFLLGKTWMVERSKQRTTSLRPEEERQRMETGWRFWDWVLQLISTGNSKELAAFVAQPER